MNYRLVDRQQLDDENRVFSKNFGGLNTTSSIINTPYEDSPVLYNCNIDVSGNISKRKGTRILRSDVTTHNKGYGYFNFITGNQYSYLVEKNGVGLNIYSSSNGELSLVMSKNNVWSALVENTIPNFTRTSEINPRLIICTGENKPIQLQFSEYQYLSQGAGTTLVISSAPKFLFNSSLTNTLVYKNGVLVTPSSITKNPLAPVITVDGVSRESGDVFDLICVTWQHLCEALFLKGSDFIGRVTRENELPINQNVRVPDSLSQQDIPSDYPNPFQFGYAVYNSNKWDWNGDLNYQLGYSITQTPTDSTTWASGDGSFYDSTVGGSVNPSPNFITFGALTGVNSPPEEIFIAKRFDLLPYFNGGQLLNWDSINILVDGGNSTGFKAFNTNAPTAANSPATYAERLGIFYLLGNDAVVGVSGDTDIRYLTFEAGDPMGLNEESEVEIINTNVGQYIGSSATSSMVDFQDGSVSPLYGAGYWFDYLRGIFPKYCILFENRVVFSGFSNNPLKLVFSEYNDSTIPLKPFRKLQIRLFDTLATDPIDFNLSGTADDYVTGLAFWQTSLIAFTRKSVFIVSGSPEAGVTSTSINSSIISNQGLVNNRSWAITDDSLLYLSDSGVQRIDFGLATDTFDSKEVSLKIRSVFGVTRNIDYVEQSFMIYDSQFRRVYLGLPNENESNFTCKRLFVYEVFRGAWTEYKIEGGFKLWSALELRDNTSSTSVIGIYRGYTTVPVKLVIEFDCPHYVDFYQESLGTGTQLDLSIPIYHSRVNFTTIQRVLTYYINDFSNEDNWFFMLPNDDINDLYVTLDGELLNFKSDYVKHHIENSIELLLLPAPGQSLVISKRTPITDYEAYRNSFEIDAPIYSHSPIHLVVDNVPKLHSIDFTVDSQSTQQINITTVNHPGNNSKIYFGRYYEARYVSPFLSQNTLANLKKCKAVYCFFDNRDGLEHWTISDVNVASGQLPEFLVSRLKQRLNAAVEIHFQSQDGSDVGYDLYNQWSTLFDFTLFDVTDSPQQSRQYSMFKETLSGIGYGYQISVWSYDDTTFTLSAWQISSKVAGQRHVNFAI